MPVYSLYQMFVHSKLTILTRHEQRVVNVICLPRFHHVCLCKITTKYKYHPVVSSDNSAIKLSK